MHEHPIHAFIPNGLGGLDIVDVAELIHELGEGLRLEDATNAASIDTVSTRADIDSAAARVHALNMTGDAAAYWNL